MVREDLPPGTWPLVHLGKGLLWPFHPAEGLAQKGSPGTRSPSSSSSESSGQDSGVEPLLSVTWLWPEGWSLALRSRRSGPGPWTEMEPLWLGDHPHPPHPSVASFSSGSQRDPLRVLPALGTAGSLCQDSSRRGGSKGRKLLAG